MENIEFILEGRRCHVVQGAEDEPAALLIEPIDRRDLEFLDREVDFLRERASRGFVLASFIVEDWNIELSPWRADPVFGKEAFGEGAAQTLRFIEDSLIPEIHARVPALKGKEIVLGATL